MTKLRSLCPAAYAYSATNTPLVRRERYLVPSGAIPYARHLDRKLLVGEVDRTRLLAPAHDPGVSVAVGVARSGQCGRLLRERFLHGLEAKRYERLDQGQHRRHVVDGNGELRRARRGVAGDDWFFGVSCRTLGMGGVLGV